MRYVVEEVVLPRGKFWTVVEYDGDHCRGGDHHWLERWFAEEAQAAYEAGTAQHGDPSRVVVAARGSL